MSIITYSDLSEPSREHCLKGKSLFETKESDINILKTMHEETYEELVAAWAFWCLKNGTAQKYEDVSRIGGAGDKGVDVIAFINQKTRKCDIYQCKHYGHAISQSDVIAELGKFLYFMSTGDIPIPETYYLMGPEGLSGQYTLIYTNPEKLKNSIKTNWNKCIAEKIEKGHSHPFEGALVDFIENFDYTKFQTYSQDKFLKNLLECEKRYVYFQYFGYRREYLKRIKKETPTKLDDYEKKYTKYLFDAYNDVKGVVEIDETNIAGSNFAKHFGRSRDEFWLAESVKKMEDENNPGDIDEFEELKDDVLDFVSDTFEENYKNAFEKVKAVTGKAATMTKKDRIISGEVGARELKGVCYQLSNEDKLIWKEGKY